MKVILIATRELNGRLTGRKTVLRTIVQTLSALGHEVVVLVLGREAFAAKVDNSLNVRMVGLKLPGLARIVVNVMWYHTRGKLSLNECLYFSLGLRASVRRLCRREQADLVIADMIRTAELAEHAALPWILDLDDLLSSRYTAWCENGADLSAILGYYCELIPRAVRPSAQWFAAALLRREAKLLVEREVELARRATAVSLVSGVEAEQFALRSGRRVHSLPMVVNVPDLCRSSPLVGRLEMAFVGGLDYQPNLEAVLYFVHVVAPALQRSGISPFRLHVFGSCPSEKVADLQGDQIALHGYIDDLCAALAPCTMFLCPLQSGTGIKTKIVEALMLGLPVVTTSIGTQGLDLVHGEHCYIWQTPSDLVKILKHMQAAPERVAEVARAGQEYARNRFSPKALERCWSEVLESLSHPSGSSSEAESQPKRLWSNNFIAATSAAAWKRILRTVTTHVDST